jgi:bifunctional non-homologous end joining protein LigD
LTPPASEAGNRREVEVDGRVLTLSNLDKPMYPAAGFTKAGVIDYYARIADAMLPHLAGRPLTLTRYPNGVEGQRFYEKRCPKHAPDWVKRAPVEMGSVGRIDFCVCEERATLIWLAQLAALELHPSLSLAEDIEHPTVLAFDLDPGAPAGIVECCRLALKLRELFGELGLECFPKTSGSKGLQVYVPLNSGAGYDQTKSFARGVAQALERTDPDLVTSRMAKAERPGKIFVDWSQNDRAKTTVAVYSLRAKERPTASTPIDWDEAESAAKGDDQDALRFEAHEVVERFERRGDLFAPVLELRQELPDFRATK